MSSNDPTPPPSGKVAQFFMTFEKDSNGGLKSDEQAQKIINVVKCLIAKGYKHIGLTYSANQAQTEQIFIDYKYNKDSSDNTFASGEEKDISSQIINGANQARVLTELNKIIKDNASYSEFKKAFRVIPFTTMRYEKQGTPPVEVGVDLDKSKPGNNNECIEAAKAFLQLPLPLPDSIILGWCNQDCGKMNDALDKTKQKFAIGGGVAASLSLANSKYIPEYLQFLTSVWDEDVQKIVTECSPDPKSVDSPASPPPPSKPPATQPATPLVEKKPFADVIKDLEGKLSKNSENDTEIQKLGITLPDLSYPLNGSDTDKKNLNSAEPAIDIMITEFESATDEGDKNFYLGACKSIQAAYDLDVILAGTDNDKKMRAKLLLNLRKNSLLLKVPARWDYATMKPGVEVEPELTPEEEKEMFIKLQQECAKLKQSGGNDYASSEEAYRLAEKLIQLSEKIESDKLEKKNKFVEENYPETKITYPTIADVIPEFKVIIDQNSDNCGRAALANFFGTEDFLIKGDPAKTEEIFDLKNQRPKKIDMSSICHLNKKYSDIFAEAPNNPEDKKDYDYVTKCPTSENYSINVLSIVLQVLGYMDLLGITFDKSHADVYSKNKDNLNTSYNNKDVLGYLVNINKGHWVCYKRQDLDSTTNSFYRIDSMTGTNFSDARTLEKLVEYDSTTQDKNFIQLHPITKNDDSNNQKIFDTLSKNGGNINFYKDRITENETSNKFKLFKKDVTSELAKDATFFDINNQVRILNYLSNLPSNKSTTNTQITIGLNDTNKPYGSIQSKIISLDKDKKKIVIDIFIKNIRDNLNKLEFITANKCKLRNLGFDKEDNTFEPDIDAEIRYYNSLTETCKYNRGKDFTDTLKTNGYFESANELLVSIDTLFKTSDFTASSSSGGGFKPRHNPITNHTASKSRHNSSFKVSSSSKSKGKSHNRSHTQRVK